MAYCQTCGTKFGDDWSLASRCPACKREEESRSRREEQETEREARRQAAEDARHNERLEAEENRFQKQLELDEERSRDEELRQLDQEFREEERQRDREYEREAAAADKEAQREEFLVRQRDQLANAWRYAAESKLQQADKLYQAGARKDALALAMEASALGVDAQRLIGWIHRDSGDKSKYLEQLQVQVGLLGVAEFESANQQERVLGEIIALGKEGNDLLTKYFDVANKCQRFPYAIHPSLSANGLLSLELYHTLLSQHIDNIAKEQEENTSTQYGGRFLSLLLSLPKNEELLNRYVAASKHWLYFPSKIIALLLEKQDIKRATEVFTNSSKVIKEDAANDVYVWQVCPIGAELCERGAQPRSWAKKFQATVDKLPLGQIKTSNLKEILESTVMSAKTKALIRETVNVKGKHSLASERAEMWKSLRKDKQSPSGLPWYQSPSILAVATAGGLAYLMWYTGSGAITAFIAAIPIYLGSALIKKSSNAKLFAQIRLADWFERRRAAVGSALLLNDADALKSFGSTDRPTHALRLLQDVAAMILLLGLAFGAILYLTQSDFKARGLVRSSIEWTRDWDVFIPATRDRQTARLGLDESGTPTLSFYEHTIFGTVKSDPRSIARLTQCVGSKVNVTCSATMSIIGMAKFQATPSRLDLDLASGAGNFSIYPRNEPVFVVQLQGTPSSLNDAPDWVSVSAPAPAPVSAPVPVPLPPAVPVVVPPPPAGAIASSTAVPMPTVAMAQDPNSGCHVWKPSLAPNDAVTWLGPCVDGFAEGPGTAQWTADGKNTLTYEGTFRSGLLQGGGKMTGAGGDRYEGDYRDGKREGHGVYISGTGDRYDGEFKDNKRHGRGTLTRADGSRVEGIITDGKPPADTAPLPSSSER